MIKKMRMKNLLRVNTQNVNIKNIKKWFKELKTRFNADERELEKKKQKINRWIGDGMSKRERNENSLV